jgi:hypothetical protein
MKYGKPYSNASRLCLVARSAFDAFFTDFQPGSLAVDFFPFLGYLPESLQPMKRFAMSLRAREMRLNRAFLRTIKSQVKQGAPPECFGSQLLRVRCRSKVLYLKLTGR